MAIFKTDIADIELNSGTIHRSFLNHTIGSGDNLANRFGVRVFRNGQPENIGGTCAGYFVRADGGTVVIANGTVSGNEAYVDLPDNCYAVEGQFALAIKCAVNGSIGTLRIVDGIVSRTSTDSPVDPGTIIPSIEDLIEAINEAVESIPPDYSDLWASLAPEFSSSTAYAMGQYVTYDGGLYRFKTAHTAGTWNAAHVTLVSMGSDVADIKSVINSEQASIARVPISFQGITNESSWTVGQGIAERTGANMADTKYCRTGYIQIPETILITMESADYEFSVWEYTGQSVGSALRSPKNGKYTNDQVIISNGSASYFRIGVRRVDEADITSSDITVLTTAIKTFCITDKTLALSGFPADSKAVGDLKKSIDESFESIMKYGGIDLVTLQKIYSSTTLYGITFTWDDDGSCTISGTATDNTYNNIAGNTRELAEGIVPGNKYHVDFHGGSIPVRVYWYNPDSHLETYTDSFDFTVPNDATAVLFRFQIDSGTAITTPVKVKYTITLARGSDSGQTINNTYNITTSPQITTDTNGWLQAVDTETSSDTGKTDMTGAIMSMLNDTGYCHLGEGIFYVSGNIDMPEGSMIEGCGKKTIVRLLSSVETGYVIRMRSKCTLQNVTISGAYSSSTPSNEGTRDGIWFEANYNDPEDVGEFTTNHCMVSNVWVENFSGSGLYCHNTSINYAKGIYVNNAYISYCYKGINIDYYSEFNKFTNICVVWCYIACVNNGGNNVFSACTFHATNTGFKIDGTQPNSAHGTLNGCTFCHIGSNSGKAIDMADITAGFVVSACQFWYNSIDIKNCDGIAFNGCEFGRGTTGNGMNINIDGGNLVMFAGCVFNNDLSKPPQFSITNNAKARFNGCYGGTSGDLINPTE